VTGYHDGGDGVCVPNGICSAGFHDGGDGACVRDGTCSTGYKLCVNTCGTMGVPDQPSAIAGNPAPYQSSTNMVYSVVNVPGTIYQWTYSFPSATTITAGDTTNSITVDYSGSAPPGIWTVVPSNSCGPGLARILDVNVLFAYSGRTCAEAHQLTTAPSSARLLGSFSAPTGVVGSCASYGLTGNGVWYSYSPSTSGNYLITANDESASSASKVLVVLSGGSCSPLSPELVCAQTSSAPVSQSATLLAGNTYLIVYLRATTVNLILRNPSISIQ